MPYRVEKNGAGFKLYNTNTQSYAKKSFKTKEKFKKRQPSILLRMLLGFQKRKIQKLREMLFPQLENHP